MYYSEVYRDEQPSISGLQKVIVLYSEKIREPGFICLLSIFTVHMKLKSCLLVDGDCDAGRVLSFLRKLHRVLIVEFSAEDVDEHRRTFRASSFSTSGQGRCLMFLSRTVRERRTQHECGSIELVNSSSIVGHCNGNRRFQCGICTLVSNHLNLKVRQRSVIQVHVHATHPKIILYRQLSIPLSYLVPSSIERIFVPTG